MKKRRLKQDRFGLLEIESWPFEIKIMSDEDTETDVQVIHIERKNLKKFIKKLNDCL